MKEGKALPERLKVDRLRSFGGFASASSQHHFTEGLSLPGLAFDRRDWAFLADMQACSVSCVRACVARPSSTTAITPHLFPLFAWQATSPEDQRQAIAKEHNVKGSFAFFRDGCVFEFGGDGSMDEEKVKGLLKQFGGTRGPKPAE